MWPENNTFIEQTVVKIENEIIGTRSLREKLRKNFDIGYDIRIPYTVYYFEICLGALTSSATV